MALMLLPVLLLGVIAAAADDVPITWWSGQRATLPCSVPHPERVLLRRPPPPLEGDDRPRTRPYVWRRGDEEITNKRILPSGALEVSRRRDGEGQYQCLMRHQAGLVMGFPTNLKFSVMAKQIFVVPENATTVANQPFALNCSHNSSSPSTFAWMKNDLPLPDDDRYHIIDSQLLITDVTEADSGSYRCIATFTYHNKSRTSHVGRLTVDPRSQEVELGFLPIQYQSDILLPRGSRAVLPCPVVYWPRPRLLWELTNPGSRKAEMDFVDEVLVIRSLQEEDQGVYTCSVPDTNLSRTFNITLTTPVTITIPPTSKEVLRASTVRFNCTAVGNPQPTITWYKDGQALTLGGGRYNLRKSADGQRMELVISGVTSDDAGVYQCFAQNAVSMDSSWATLNVTGADAAPPTDVRCWPLGDRKVKVTWKKPALGTVVAYTVHGTPVEDKAGSSLPGNPLTNTEEIVTVASPLIPYRFQARAFIKNAASDFSKGAVCQGQGVPIRLAKVNDTSVLISWKPFAEETPGVKQWILQYKPGNNSVERNVTLDGAVYNYTLNASPVAPQLVRVLGSRSHSWLHQNLTLVPWYSTADALATLDAGDAIPTPQELNVTQLSTREMTVNWSCEDPEKKYSYLICVRNGFGKTCQESDIKSSTFNGLKPGTKYEILVQARSTDGKGSVGAFSSPYIISTPSENPARFKELTGKFINSSTLKVSWNGAPGRYKVHYSAELRAVELWDSVETDNSSSVLITGIDPTEMTYLMVTGYDPEEHSKIETIPPLYKDLEAKDLHYEYTSSGLRVWWSGSGVKVVIYAQNITQPLEQWTSVLGSKNSVEITNLDPSLRTYVMVTSNKKQRNQVLTIEPRPIDNAPLYWGVGIAMGVCVLAVMLLAAICLWRKRKRTRSPATRSRRRRAASNDENIEEEAEMKAAAAGVGGAAAGARGAPRNGVAEPLLNGHVHITENPSSKTPNGKMKKGLRYEAAFDVSRYEDPETTQETVLDADTSTSTTFHLLDTSRRPEYDVSRSSREMSTNNSFAKLPDDNMNSELTRSSFQLDSSKILPTLQPNG